MAARRDTIVTPEAVALQVDVAGVGSRMIAAIVDVAIQLAVGIGLGFLLFRVGSDLESGRGTAFLVIVIVLFFVLVWGYYPLFELFWNGRTPGKRIQRIRVVKTDGQPVTGAAVLVRNLVRVVDWFPAWYAIGVITMVLTRRSQRLGDLAAGTLVIRERPPPLPAQLDLPDEPAGEGVPLDATGVNEREYGLVHSFLERRERLTPEARAALARQLASGLRPKAPGPTEASLGDEAFLEALARAYRARSAGSPPVRDAAPPHREIPAGPP